MEVTVLPQFCTYNSRSKPPETGGRMKFLGLKIFVCMLEVAAFALITPCLIVIAIVLVDPDQRLNWQFVVQSAVAVALVGGVLFAGVVMLALAQLLQVM